MKDHSYAIAFGELQTQIAKSPKLGERIEANKDHWLLRAPQANPGMIEMFHLRDRQPSPNLVPWAGEFVGKETFQIAPMSAARMTTT